MGCSDQICLERSGCLTRCGDELKHEHDITRRTKSKKHISWKRNNVGNWVQNASVDRQPEEKDMNAGRNSNEKVIKIV